MKKINYISTLSIALLCLSAEATQPAIEEVRIPLTTKEIDNNTLDDLALQVKIIKALSKQQYKKLHFSICKGIVVLIGDLSKELAQDAVNKVQAVEGVRRVFYEPATIPVGALAADNNGTALTISIKEKMTRSFGVDASNFTVTSVGKVVYITGLVTNAHEEAVILDIVRNEEGADKVKLYLVKTYQNDKPRINK